MIPSASARSPPSRTGVGLLSRWEGIGGYLSTHGGQVYSWLGQDVGAICARVTAPEAALAGGFAEALQAYGDLGGVAM